MFYSLLGIIQPAKDENEANKTICELNNKLILDEIVSDSWIAAGIFETKEINDFMRQFEENIKQFFKEYEEKCQNVQNY